MGADGAGVMSTPAHLLVRPPPHVRAFTFVWESWRALDARFLRSALAFAVVLGVLHGTSAAIIQNAAWWRSFLSEFTDTLFATVALVLCVTIAARIRTKRLPRWLPYIVAACAAFVVNEVLMSFAVVPALVALVADKTQWPGITMPTLQGIWIHWPRMLIFLSLGAVGFMFAHEARLRADALRNVQLERAKLTRRTFESRLQAMQARIEPQFLFDTLAHVETLYETDADAAEQMLDDLIVFLRKALPSLDETTSTVDAEFSLARAWLGITKVRLDGRLQFAVTGPEDAAGIRMPPMLLLPLLERAAEPVTRSGLPKLVEISACVADDRVRIAVAETNPGTNDRRTETLAQIRERLHSLYGSRASLELSDDDTVRRTTMEIPYERTDSDHR